MLKQFRLTLVEENSDDDFTPYEHRVYTNVRAIPNPKLYFGAETMTSTLEELVVSDLCTELKQYYSEHMNVDKFMPIEQSKEIKISAIELTKRDRDMLNIIVGEWLNEKQIYLNQLNSALKDASEENKTNYRTTLSSIKNEIVQAERLIKKLKEGKKNETNN